MNVNYITLLRALLVSRPWSQQQLAGELKVTHAALSRWLHGHAVPHPRHQKTIQDLYRRFVGFPSLGPHEREEMERKILGMRTRGIWKRIKKDSHLKDDLLLEQTWNSNVIEGSTLTKRETEAVIFDQAHLPDKSLVEHLEVSNHAAVLRDLLEQKFPEILTESLVCDLHRRILQGIRKDAGEYAKHHRAIRGVEIVLTHPRDIPEEMNRLMVWWKRISKGKPSLEPIAQFHADFEQIHPFADGNGRVGRLLMIHQLLKWDFPPVIIESSRKGEYYETLEYAQKKSLEPWLAFLADEMGRTMKIFQKHQMRKLEA